MNNNSPKITFEMLSDWHIGTGSGIPGSVDALLARDADGFPCIPAKTVVGIWRDAMETLTLGLDGGDEKNKNWQNWVDVIFGSQPNVDKNPIETPRPAILSIQSARIDENLRKAIKNSSKLDQTKYKQALTFVKPNTRIDSKSGTAETESLRFTEMGRIGSVLNSKFEIDFADFKEKEDEKELVKALLKASAVLIERIGGNRRRGSGKCEMKVDCGAMDAITVLEKYRTDSLPSIPQIQAKEELESAQKDDSSKWKRIEYSLTLQTPVAIVTNTLGNVSETLDFIPGTYLLPHFTKQLTGISKYVASGDFQILPATICVNENRGLPVPRVLSAHKVDGGFEIEKTVFNKLEDETDDKTPQLKPFREGYVSDLGETDKQLPFYETTKKILLMHNTVEDEFQRPTENVGGVFSRQAIEAGTVLKGEIRFKASIGKDLEFSKVGGYVRLGTSKKDDYGLADLNLKPSEDAKSEVTATTNLIVYLASDVLLRNGNLRQTNLVADLKAKLEQELSVNLTEKESLIQVRRIESWHEGWGLPRPTFSAMAAGSVAVFEVVGEIDSKLQNLELSGIGERRGEGYGQIKFNPKILTEKINGWKIAVKDDDKAKIEENQKIERENAVKQLKNQIKTANKFKKFVENLEVSAWREEIARAVLKIANVDKERLEIFGFKGDTPSMSQIGGLRSAVGKVKLDGSNKSVVTYWLTHLQATSNRNDKWKHGFGKIKELFANNSEVWKCLEAKDGNGKSLYFSKPNLLISDENILKEKLWAEAVKSLFDACARAHKRSTEDNQ